MNFSLLSGIPYPDYIKAIAESNLSAGVMSAEASLAAGHTVANAVSTSGAQTVMALQDGAQMTTSAISQSTDAITSMMTKSIVANLFGSTVVAGTIIAATIKISRQLDRVMYGIDRLGASFDAGMSLLASKLDIQSETLISINDQLVSIHGTLKSPTITQTNELRNLGLERLSIDLYKESLDSFEKAIAINDVDPISHLMIGKIYLDCVQHDFTPYNPKKALEHFTKAEKFSEAMTQKASSLKDILHDAIYFSALAHIALASSTENTVEQKAAELNSAKQALDKFLAKFKDSLQGRYLRIKTCIYIGDQATAISDMKELISRDVKYLYSAANDIDFSDSSPIGHNVLFSMETWLKSETSKYCETFFYYHDILNARGDVPEGVTKWLNLEGAKTKSDFLNLINQTEFRAMLAKTPPMLESMFTASIGMETVYNERKAHYTTEYNKYKTMLVKAVESFSDIYTDKAWLNNLSAIKPNIGTTIEAIKENAQKLDLLIDQNLNPSRSIDQIKELSDLAGEVLNKTETVQSACCSFTTKSSTDNAGCLTTLIIVFVSPTIIFFVPTSGLSSLWGLLGVGVYFCIYRPIFFSRRRQIAIIDRDILSSNIQAVCNKVGGSEEFTIKILQSVRTRCIRERGMGKKQ